MYVLFISHSSLEHPFSIDYRGESEHLDANVFRTPNSGFLLCLVCGY